MNPDSRKRWVDRRFAEIGQSQLHGLYRLAQTKNVAQVSLEMGNTPRMVFAHCREVATERQAEQWFRILPSRAGKIVSLAVRME